MASNPKANAPDALKPTQTGGSDQETSLPARSQTMTEALDDTDRKLCDLLQREFPLTSRPFAALGERLGVSEAETLERTRRLKADGLIRQISAIFDSGRVGYRSLLAAFRVEPERLEAVAGAVARHDGVTHAYEREHRLNFWFTITCPPGTDPEAECARLADEQNVAEWVALPATRTYKIGVMLPMGDWASEEGAAVNSAINGASPQEMLARNEGVSDDDFSAKGNGQRLPCACDRALIRTLQQDLPLVEQPFRPWAEELGLSQEALLQQTRELLERGMMRRFAAVLRHRRAGFRANGMACWEAATEDLDRLGPLVAWNVAVSHCYARRVAPPLWTHNLFAMIHGRSPDEVAVTVDEIRRRTGLPEPMMLYSVREFKKSRARYYMTPDLVHD